MRLINGGMQRSGSHDHLTYIKSKRKGMKKYVFLLGLWMQVASVVAQEPPVRKSVLSVHAGPSWYLGKMIGITNHSDAYRNALRNGIAWDADYYFLGDAHPFDSFKLAPGLVYQGGRYANTHDESSDNIQMHYIAPQLALFMMKRNYHLSLSAGAGYQHYKDKSVVYGKPRKVSMNKLACNLSAGGEYLLAPCMGVSARLNWVVTSSDSYSVRYHGQKWQVNAPELSDGGRCFSHLSLLFGMNLHF